MALADACERRPAAHVGGELHVDGSGCRDLQARYYGRYTQCISAAVGCLGEINPATGRLGRQPASLRTCVRLLVALLLHQWR